MPFRRSSPRYDAGKAGTSATDELRRAYAHISLRTQSTKVALFQFALFQFALFQFELFQFALFQFELFQFALF
ncbi:MAG TPA: hypothetical protein VJT84_07190 [Gaiellaceae bacterium]|nr:hypothetical protein [Gaiellaceae bacterium]